MMQNKSIQISPSKIRPYKLLKKKLKMIIVNKSLYSSLIILISFQNLVNVTLQECRFNFLQENFFQLPYFQEITLPKNYVINTAHYAWKWLDQSSIISNFELLKIRNNDLPISSLEITCLKNFTKLTIKGNRINSSLKEFGPLPHLTIDLSGNNIGRSEQFAWEWLNLRILDISYNYLTAVPLQINYMKNLRSLFLYGNEIKFSLKEFGNLSQLMNLDLTNNLLRMGEHSTWKWLENSIRDNLSRLRLRDNSLTEFPLQITLLTNLKLLDISKNNIEFLPKELGTLPHLTVLNLTSNRLGNSDRNPWEWLEQDAIRNKLSQLYLCENLLTELPPQIGKLNALTILDLARNELERLPQILVNLKKLEVLDLHNNKLLYLPGSITHLLIRINVEQNPFNLEDSDNLTTKSEVPSLMECSAEVIVKYRLKTVIDRKKYAVLLRYVENWENYGFFCKKPCFIYYEKGFMKYPEYHALMYVEMNGTSNIRNASFECYACSSSCATALNFKKYYVTFDN